MAKHSLIEPIVSVDEVSDWDVEVDVVVVGAGGCGLTAALAAGERGSTVFLLDRDHRMTCNTARSGGMMPAAATKLQRDAGIVESADHFSQDVLRKNHSASDRDTTLHLCRTATKVVDWLTGVHNVDLELATDFLYPGHTEYRMHSAPDRTGSALVADLRRANAALAGVHYVPDVNCETLVADGDGAVVGAIVNSGSREAVRSRKVILACNGFAGNRETVRRFIPEVAGALYFGGESSTGEGIIWGQALGADVAFMDAYQCHATVAMPGEILVTYSITTEGGFHVNLRGERFAKETRGYSEHALDVLRQPEGIAIVIYDERIHRLGLTFPDYRECADTGLVKFEQSLESLATLFHLPPDALATTLAEYERGREAGIDRWGREDFADLRPPYYGVRVTGALFHTQGGLKVDSHGRVLKKSGEPVPNLYAGGGVAAGVSGHGPEGYLSGNGLLTALGYGYLAGLHAAASLDVEAGDP